MTAKRKRTMDDISHLPTNFFYTELKNRGLVGYHSKVENMMKEAEIPHVVTPLGTGGRASTLWEAGPARAWLHNFIEEHTKPKPKEVAKTPESPAISLQELRHIRRDMDTIADGVNQILKTKSPAVDTSTAADVAIVRQDVLAIRDQLMGIQELLTHMEQMHKRHEQTLENILDVVTAPQEASNEPIDIDAALAQHDDQKH
jgi:hypothetical protein